MDITFYSICPTPFEPAGHGFIYHQCFKNIIESLGHQHKAFLSFATPPELALENWHSHFKPVRSLLTRRNEFKALFKLKTFEKRIFFLEAFNLIDFSGLTAALLSLSSNDQLWILLRYGLHHLKKKKYLFLLCLKALQKKLKNRLVLLTDSDLIKADYAPYFSLQVLPIPHVPKITSFQKEENLCWWPGDPRPPKGLAEIQTIAKNQELAAAHFQLAVSENAALPTPSHLSIHYVPKHLSRFEYETLLSKASFIFLPYDPFVYRSSTSGIFIESILFGAIPLVKPGSWLANELSAHNLQELIVNWNCPSFFTYLLKLKDNNAMLNKLKIMQNYYKSFHSEENYKKIIHSLIKY